MTKVNMQDLRENTMAFECLPYGSWFLFDEYVYIKVKPFAIPNEEQCYNAIGTDGIAYYFENETIEPIEQISLIIEK